MYVFPRQPRLPAFADACSQLDWANIKILDFGGNRGNLVEDLTESYTNYDTQHYTSLDVDQHALRLGQLKFPLANWVKYNAYNPVYNPGGQKFSVLPFSDNQFDVAVAYSVHSHTLHDDMIWDLRELLRVSKKYVITTIVDNLNAVDYFINKRLNTSGKAPHKDIFKNSEFLNYFVNDDIVVSDFVAEDHGYLEHFVTVYNTDALLKHLSEQGFNVRLHYSHVKNTQPMMIFKK
jgi:ubiquinone/menaquinone biosynthesis C-methylase UbiE